MQTPVMAEHWSCGYAKCVKPQHNPISLGSELQESHQYGDGRWRVDMSSLRRLRNVSLLQRTRWDYRGSEAGWLDGVL
jgi:hypothetical protein